MELRLSDTQRAYLHSQPVPEGHANKIRLALRLVGGTQGDLADALGMSNQQLGRYVKGRDLMLSTAHRIAVVFGVGVDDLWPPPSAAVDRRNTKRQPTKAKGRVAPKAKTRTPKAKVAA